MQENRSPAPTQRDPQLQKEERERDRPRENKSQDGGTIGSGGVSHVLETGLPPGIRPDEAADPGKAQEHGPVDNRS